jgi:biopolymer transport protein ExbD
MFLPRRIAPKANINVTPLVDVVLVLLIVFLVIAPALEPQLGVVLPESRPQAAPTPPSDAQIVIVLTESGEAVLDGAPMTDEQLVLELHARLRPRRDRTVFFRGHPQARYGRAVAVLDIARDAGATVLGAVVQDTGGEDAN